MRIKALKQITGLVTMAKGEERNVREEIAASLIKLGYAKGAVEKNANNTPPEPPPADPPPPPAGEGQGT